MPSMIKPPTKKNMNTEELRNAMRAHILESVTDYNGDVFPTEEEAINHLKNEFERVANYPYNLQKFPNNQDRFNDYLMGIPFGFEFEYHRIVEFLDSLGFNPRGSQFSDDTSAKFYSYLIFKEI